MCMSRRRVSSPPYCLEIFPESTEECHAAQVAVSGEPPSCPLADDDSGALLTAVPFSSPIGLHVVVAVTVVGFYHGTAQAITLVAILRAELPGMNGVKSANG